MVVVVKAPTAVDAVIAVVAGQGFSLGGNDQSFNLFHFENVHGDVVTSCDSGGAQLPYV